MKLNSKIREVEDLRKKFFDETEEKNKRVTQLQIEIKDLQDRLNELILKGQSIENKNKEKLTS